MTQKVADQHALLTRWREIADELAASVRAEGHAHVEPFVASCRSCAALRRYEEARAE